MIGIDSFLIVTHGASAIEKRSACGSNCFSQDRLALMLDEPTGNLDLNLVESLNHDPTKRCNFSGLNVWEAGPSLRM